jgi:hypothetical protein
MPRLLSTLEKLERRFADADANILHRGLSLTRLIACDFRWGAGTRVVPDIDEPERRERNGTGSGEGCPELAQVGATLAWTTRRLTSAFLTLSSTFLPPFSPFLDSQISSYAATRGCRAWLAVAEPKPRRVAV